ncbi:MAG: DsbA family oxidoreductase [Aliishimia sp.]
MTQSDSDQTMFQSPDLVVQVDIISDVMCPWCIVGFKQLEMALGQTGIGARVRWHPFELNPDMGPDGENTADHIMRKYGTSRAQSKEARAQLKDIGQALGFAFNFSADSRIVNSFKAHQLLDYAATKGLQHPLKLALFKAHFTEGRDVSCQTVLLEVAAANGLEAAEVETVLAQDRHAKAVRAQERVWAQNGISGVPTMIFNEKFVLTGAQGPQAYAHVLQDVLSGET